MAEMMRLSAEDVLKRHDKALTKKEDFRDLYEECYEFYDQSRDSMFYLSWKDLYKASFPKKFTEVNKIVIDTSD